MHVRKHDARMSKLLVLVIQLALAALAGYWGGQHARSDAVTSAKLLPPSTAPQPEPPRNTPPAAAAAANLSISYRLAVEKAAPSVVTVYSARTTEVGPFGLGGRQL